MSDKTEQGIEDEAEGKPSSVGFLLRASRERQGDDLRAVSEALRIRHTYLKAIEEGDFEDLPGPTYAVGFIRTYAEHLGLDGEEVVRRFKAELEGREGRAQLRFPTPISEGKVPSGALILLGVVLAVIAYGVWYTLSSSGNDAADMVSEVPPHLAEPTPKVEAPVVSAEEANKRVEDARLAAEAQRVAEENAAEAAKAAAPAPVPEAAPESTLAPEGVPEEVIEVAEEAPAAPTSEPPAVQPQPQAQDVAVPEAQPPTEPVQEALQPDQPPTPQEPRVFGGENADARIVIIAGGDSWVEVREGEEIVLTRLFHKGDTYFVPNRSNLILNTGNAGPLTVEVDGSPVPVLGKDGEVLFNVPLDPAQLREGKIRDN